MIRKLEWDSNFFGFNIAHLEFDEHPKSVSVDDFVRLNNIKCLQSICDISEIKTINLLERSGFTFADLRITYTLDLNERQFKKNELLTAQKNDASALKEIARSIAVNSRYYAARFGTKKVEELYEIWLEKSIDGQFDHICLKVMDSKRPVGFATIKFSGLENAKIGLFGIHQDYQNKGYGKKLMISIFTFLNEKGFKRIEVSTQGKNIPAQKFYIGNGFKVDNLRVWFYKFFENH